MDSNTIGALTGIVVPVAGIAMIVVIVWLSLWLTLKKTQAQTQARAELHKQFLDKFQSGGELAQFLETEEGKKMLGNLGSDRTSPEERALNHIRAGFILSFLGIGFLVLTLREPGLAIPGGILLAVGLGFLAAAAISRRLAKEWNVNGTKSTDKPAAPRADSLAG